MQRLMLAIAAFVLAVGVRYARAADEVVIGALYPMTGPNAQVGNDAKAAMETAAEIINGSHNIPMLLGKGGGLDKLGGAKVRLIFADHQGDPQKARAEAERLITQEHVVALIGSYQSATAATISQVADRYEVPYMSADNSSPSLNQRGLKWFFRTSPHDVMFTQAMFDFFRDIGCEDRAQGAAASCCSTRTRSSAPTARTRRSRWRRRRASRWRPTSAIAATRRRCRPRCSRSRRRMPM